MKTMKENKERKVGSQITDLLGRLVYVHKELARFMHGLLAPEE
jgi:hypothetical protein